MDRRSATALAAAVLLFACSHLLFAFVPPSKAVDFQSACIVYPITASCVHGNMTALQVTCATNGSGSFDFFHDATVDVYHIYSLDRMSSRPS